MPPNESKMEIYIFGEPQFFCMKNIFHKTYHLYSKIDIQDNVNAAWTQKGAELQQLDGRSMLMARERSYSYQWRTN